jgi:rhodanese-related sulfurtransferase
MTIATISPSELSQRRKSGQSCDLIDVRTPLEFRDTHVEFAKNVPLDQLDPVGIMKARNGSAGEPLYVICQMGGRGKQACEAFQKKGFANVFNVEGGTKACEQSDLPIVHGKKAISIERQVRIVAGSIVLIGVILGFLVHPYFFGLSGFIGAGLLFAGITDTCGMGMMLAKMPWNK